jgi:hypothetical protein
VLGAGVYVMITVCKKLVLYTYNFIHRKAVETLANNKIGIRRYSDMAKLQNKLSVDCSLHENLRIRVGSSAIGCKKPILTINETFANDMTFTGS